MFKNALPHIVECLEGRDTPISTGEDALYTLRIIKAAEKSAMLAGRKVYL
jgi:hypothetical protein